MGARHSCPETTYAAHCCAGPVYAQHLTALHQSACPTPAPRVCRRRCARCRWAPARRRSSGRCARCARCAPARRRGRTPPAPAAACSCRGPGPAPGQSQPAAGGSQVSMPAQHAGARWGHNIARPERSASETTRPARHCKMPGTNMWRQHSNPHGTQACAALLLSVAPEAHQRKAAGPCCLSLPASTPKYARHHLPAAAHRLCTHKCNPSAPPSC